MSTAAGGSGPVCGSPVGTDCGAWCVSHLIDAVRSVVLRCGAGSSPDAGPCAGVRWPVGGRSSVLRSGGGGVRGGVLGRASTPQSQRRRRPAFPAADRIGDFARMTGYSRPCPPGGADSRLIPGYGGRNEELDEAMAAFAVTYACVEAGHAELATAVGSGRCERDGGFEGAERLCLCGNSRPVARPARERGPLPSCHTLVR